MNTNISISSSSSLKPNAKRAQRRNPKACDACWSKKVRCDGTQQPGSKCSNCIATATPCTRLRPVKKPGPKSKFVKELEARLQQNNQTSDSSSQRSSKSPDPDEDGDEDEGDDFEHLDLADKFESLSFRSVEKRFFGPSSGFMIVKKVMDLKNSYTGHDVLPLQRPRFWNMHPWEIVDNIQSMPVYKFPDDDLLSSLVDIYFAKCNPYLPCIHEPSFRQSLALRLHLQNPQYAATLLLVCANAARFSNDPQVLVDGSDDGLSCGWKYYTQVPTMRKDLFNPPTLYDLQYYCLAAQYLIGAASAYTAWHLIGIGLRFAEDIGAHRRKPPNRMTPEDEMKKRCFYVLICLDRITASFLGRSVALEEEYFDVELPVECDDQYWVISSSGVEFKQPADIPSKIQAFNLQIKLCQILVQARVLYHGPKPKQSREKNARQSELKIVADLDSQLNSWLDSIPRHLQWDPNREDQIFGTQAAVLHAYYDVAQILVHRPFIQKPSALSYSAVAICANAARSCINVIERQATVYTFVPQTMMLAHFAACILLLNLWQAKVSGLSIATARELLYVEKCMQVMKVYETRWHVAGRLWDFLNQLSLIVDSPDTVAPNMQDSNLQMTSTNQSEPISLGSSHHFAPQQLPTDSASFGLLPLPPATFDPELFNVFTQSNFNHINGDTNMMDVWNTAPVGFNLEEWGTHITDPNRAEWNFSDV